MKNVSILLKPLASAIWRVGLCASALPCSVWAQAIDEPAHQLPAITVAAEKIDRTWEEVPASISVLDGMDLEQSGLTSMEQLEGRVAGLSFQPFGQAGMNSPVMRGLTANFNSFSTSTLMLVDGVPVLTAQGFENSLQDLDRIEVLRGPQSTLYGRNAEAGVIALHSRPMDDTPRASVSGEFGSNNRRVLRFAMSRPLVEDTLYASISGSWFAQDGFIDNRYRGAKEDDRKHRNLNLGLRWTPTAQTDLVLRYARQEYDDGAALWGSPTAPRAEVSSGTPSWNHSRGQTFSLNASHQFASGVRLRSITAYNDFTDRVQQDTDFMPPDMLRVGRDHRLRNLSQELRLEGRLGEAEWLVGLYGDRQDNDLANTSRMLMGSSDLRLNQQGHTLAAFTHWKVPLSQRWSLSAGARIERNQISIYPQSGERMEQDWTHVSPKLAVQYQFTPDQQWYASVARGVRTGGFNVVSPAVNYMAYDPEKNWSYETGVKGWIAQGRLRYSLAAYVMDIKNMQVMQMPVPGMMYITSAASATSKGVELDVDYLLGGGWQIKAGLAWNRTRFDRFRDGAANYDGHHNPFAPDWTGHLALRYDAPSGWYAQAGVVGSSKVYLDAENSYQRNGYGLVNLLAGYVRGNWEIAAYANNIANQTYDAVGYQNGFVTVYSPAREMGLRLTWRL